VLDGSEEWILIHVEVQHQRDENLPKRLIDYHGAIRGRYGRKVLTLVILADENPGWRPSFFQEEVLGCKLRFDFPVCKLLDLVEPAKTALAQKRPSAVIIVANWAAQQTRHNMAERGRWKWKLTRQLYEAGYEKTDILELYRLLDWLLKLPIEIEKEFRAKLDQYEKSKVMPYVTSIERFAKDEGRQEGRQEGREEGREEGRQMIREVIFETLSARFQSVSEFVRNRVQATRDETLLRQWIQQAIKSPTLADFEKGLH
jgi:predicted transposase YdaD